MTSPISIAFFLPPVSSPSVASVLFSPARFFFRHHLTKFNLHMLFIGCLIWCLMEQREAQEAHFLIWRISELRDWTDSGACSLMWRPSSSNVASPSLKLRYLNCYKKCKDKSISFWCKCVWIYERLQEISSLSVEPCEGETLIVTVFEIDKSEVHGKPYMLLSCYVLF